MSRVYIILTAICCLHLFFLSGQELPENTKQQLENLAEITEEETENDEQLQQLAYLLKDPLNLNTATADDLQQFYFLTDLQIRNFLQYRALLGNLVSLYELQSIPGWDVPTIRKVLPFIKVGMPVTLRDNIVSRFSRGEHRLLLRSSRVIEKAKGYYQSLSNHYGPNRNQYMIRYRYQYKNLLQYGITMDQDPGEPFFKTPNAKGFDFYSLHLFGRNLGIVKTFALGDYTVNLGQGLIQWQSLAFKKSAETVNIKRQSAILKPYSSAGEVMFNRGAAVSFASGKWETTLFASTKSIDASMDIDTQGRQVATSFPISGLHRTGSELRNRQSIGYASFGGNISYRHQQFAIGINAVEHQFSKPFQKRDEPYNLFSWKGNAWRNASLDYSFTHKNVHFFGEAAADKSLAKAIINGALISVDSKAELSLLHRHISKEYTAINGNAFTENLQPSNENGWYAGINIRPAASLRVAAYADLYRFPWLKFRTDAPSNGKDFLVQMTYEPDKSVSIYSRFRYESKQLNETQDSQPTNFIVAKPRQNWRLHFSYVVSKKVMIRSRLDAVWYNKAGTDAEQGFLVFAEAHYTPASKFSANLRLQYFETDGYNSRIYAYENDVLFRYSTPAFFDKGLRYYSNVHFDLNKRISFWFRWAQTVYQGKDLIGSGLDEIEGNRKSEVRVQCMIYF